MKGLYLILDLGSLLVPLLFSFHPKIQFYKQWKTVLPGMFISGIIYLVWDVLFTQQGVWGFNPDYLIGIQIYNLPLEEVLFFFCIPYACLFTHYTLTKIYPQLGLKQSTTSIVSLVYSILLLILIFAFSEQDYTFVNATVTLIIVWISYWFDSKILAKFFVTYLIILLPFFIVNGILTGSFIDNEVVWYNNLENTNLRIGTIPVEDTIYAFGMLLLPLFIARFLERTVFRPKL
ncbi:MAG: lycopene cyclase domain-containing protein [Flavobacteriales bacterium]